MKIRFLRWLAVVLVNIGILASIELVSAWVIHKRFRKANASYWREMQVEQPFALPTGWEMKANATIEDSSPTRIHTDTEGHAIVPDALSRPRFTLAVLGGSSMFGVGVTDNAANVPSQLQTLLREEYGLKVNVVNLAARGYVSLQELLVLNQYIAEHRVDMVVSVSGHNDLMRYLSGSQHPTYIKDPNSPAVVLVRKVEAGNFVIANLIPALRRTSQTANLAALEVERQKKRAKKLQKGIRQKQSTPEPALEKGAGEPGTSSRYGRAPHPTFLSAHLAHYAMIQAACDVHHTYFKLFFQPNAFTKANLCPEEKNRRLEKDFAGLAMNFDACASAQNAYRAAFNEAPKPFPYADMAAAFGETKDHVYVDSCHFNERGANLLARTLAGDLGPILQSKLAEGSQP
jgi:lysophospholipase L1-like esterase